MSPSSTTRPLLILLHGTRMNGGQWATYAEALGDLVDVVAPDLPGHGKRADEAFSLAQEIEDISAMVDAAGDRPVILAGHSLGGYAALCYAERHPDRLAGLVLMGCAAEPEGIGAWLYRRLAECWQGLGPGGMKWLDEHYFAQICDARLWAAMQAHGGQFCDIKTAWVDVMKHCSSRQLKAVQCPVLILGGSLDQLHIHARRFAAAARQATVVTKPRRTHLWPMTHPDEVARALRTWLDQNVLTSPLAA